MPLRFSPRFLASILGCVLSACAAIAPSKPPELRTASTHPMQYWISLPRDWNAQREWPVVVTIPGSHKGWRDSNENFARVRDANRYPFIIVTPIVLSNGGGDLRAGGSYNYDSTTWDRAAREKRCVFDMDGLAAVVADVAKLYHGQQRVFITGFSSGGHTANTMIMLRPELLRGAAPAGANYGGRCVFGTGERILGPFDDTVHRAFSTAAERVNLPVRYFNGTEDTHGNILIAQRDSAMSKERANGYQNVSFEMVQGMQHEEMPKPVLAYFASLLTPSERSTGDRH